MRLFFSLRRFLFSNPATAVTLFPTLGGRIRCPRCQAKSKRSQQQCISSAIRGKRHGKVHGGGRQGHCSLICNYKGNQRLDLAGANFK